jgi:hypothetical protein
MVEVIIIAEGQVIERECPYFHGWMDCLRALGGVHE